MEAEFCIIHNIILEVQTSRHILINLFGNNEVHNVLAPSESRQMGVRRSRAFVERFENRKLSKDMNFLNNQ